MTKVAVIGSGTMGNGIAHVFAQYGHDVSLIDID
ncbi:MAG TPA: 3-hydroxyacyl-CoA dehydrogenase NAD-binding domain-containing protein, partial [Gemmatimonadales bacterium]|nr:3-hydroxyacyl-CoA dehydrogenase NAD-binding domain-containing protein [Gemmatimonadales bacterium]